MTIFSFLKEAQITCDKPGDKILCDDKIKEVCAPPSMQTSIDPKDCKHKPEDITCCKTAGVFSFIEKFSSDKIKGGKADNKTDKDFNKKQLDMGQKVEREHTKSDSMAREISRDHLQEIPDYYTRLHKMEKKAPKRKEEADKEKKASSQAIFTNDPNQPKFLRKAKKFVENAANKNK